MASPVKDRKPAPLPVPNSDFYELLGSALYKSKKDLPAAETAFAKSVELNRNNSAALIKLGEVQAARNETDQAIATYNQKTASPYKLRSPQQFAAFFDGLAMIPPGIVAPTQWPELRGILERSMRMNGARHAHIAARPNWGIATPAKSPQLISAFWLK